MIWRRLGPTGLLGLLWATAPAVAGFVLLAYVGALSDFFADTGSTGPLIYTAGFVIAGGLGVLPTYAQAIVGGWVFGFALGFPAALIGFTGAAVIGYGIARTVSQDRVEQLVRENDKARTIRDALVGGGFLRTTGVVALLRCPPNSPFALTNLVMAATGVRLAPFLIGTVLGMVPRTGVAAYFAAIGAASGSRDIQEFIKDGPGPWIFAGGVIVMLIVLAVLGSIANKAIARLDAGKPLD